MTTKGVPYRWEISQPDGNDEGTDISKYSSLGAPVYINRYKVWVISQATLKNYRISGQVFTVGQHIS